MRDSEHRYRLIAENSTDMISLHDPAGVYLYVSPACKALMGFEPEQLVGRSAYEFIHPEDVAEAHRVHSKLLTGTDAVTLSFRARRREGDVRLAGTNDPRRPRKADRPRSRDPMRLRATSRAASSKSRSSARAASCFRPCLITARRSFTSRMCDGRLLLVNRRFERVFKLSRRQVLGRPPEEIFPVEFAEEYRANDRRVMEGRAPWNSRNECPRTTAFIPMSP